MGDANFSGVVFERLAWFSEATFEAGAEFTGASFMGVADFCDVSFVKTPPGFVAEMLTRARCTGLSSLRCLLVRSPPIRRRITSRCTRTASLFRWVQPG